MDTYDREIMACIRQGQQAIDSAILLVVKWYKDSVYDDCFFFLKDASQAKEVTEQIFLKLPSRLLDYQGDKIRILFSMMVNEFCIAQKPALRIKDDEDEDQLDGLSERDRVILHFRKQEMKWREVADILGIKEATARKRGERAEERLEELRKNVRKRT